MNLEQLLHDERASHAPNPLIDRTDAIITGVRRRRRGRAAATGVVTLVVVAVVAGAASRLGTVEGDSAPIAPAETSEVGEVLSLERVVEAPPLDPGRYLVSIDNAPTPAPLSPVLTVPEGYERIGSGTGVRTADFDRYLWIWDVKSVYTDPCQGSDAYQAVGPTVADLAGALAAQRGRTATSAPVPVTVGGYDGLYLELTVPAEADLSTCPDRGFYLWPGRYQQRRGQVDRIWVVDVDGHRIVFDASHHPSTDPAAVDELEAMVTTTTFAAAAGT